MLDSGESGKMVGMEGNVIVSHSISHAWEGTRTLSQEDYDLALTLSK